METVRHFMSMGKSEELRDGMEKLVRKLKRANQRFTGAKQFRTSVIVHWLKQHNLRKVQYMRYISSTERYQQDNLENLHKTVAAFHPFS